METPIKTPKEANLKPPWKKGDPSPNPSGRPKGARSYSTIRWEAFKRIGEVKGMTPEEVELLMIQSGLEKALAGDDSFYHKDLDREYGKPATPLEHSGPGGGPIHYTADKIISDIDSSLKQ